jgi:hypothetical protein
MNTVMDTTGNYEEALMLAKNGYLPVAMQAGTKIPAEKEWQQWPNRPLTEDSIARRWKFTRNGIAILCHDLAVLDVDDANKLDFVLEKCGLKRAPICRTPRGGYHVHVRVRRGMDLRRKIKVLGQDIDLLTGPSLSILPPHTNEAGVPYEWLTPGLPPIAELPIARLAWTRDRKRRRILTALVEDCDPASLLYRGRLYVDRFERAVSGQKGHTTTFVSALKIVGFVRGDRDLAWQLLRYYNATKCDPPWREEPELKHKLDDALQRAR